MLIKKTGKESEIKLLLLAFHEKKIQYRFINYRGTQKTELTEVKQRQLLYIRSPIDRWRLTLPWF